VKKNILINDQEVIIEINNQNADSVSFILNSKEYSFLKKDVLNKCVMSAPSFVVNGHEFKIENKSNKRNKKNNLDHGQMIAPMPGKILKLLTSVGSIVKAGTPILVMEAMKMEHTVKASKDGKIEKIHFIEGAQVNAGAELVTIC
jgi:biotin carboxyl carrier protein